jgi:hypothetical protein
VYALDRTHPLAEDLDWLPRELKALRWGATGASWLTLTGLAIAATVASAGALTQLAALVAAGGFFAGRRMARRLVLRRLERLAHGRLDLVRPGIEAQGRLIHVSGRVSAPSTLPSFLHAIPAVYRRMTFRFGHTRFLHEAAVDFDLVDGDGQRLRVHVDGARLFVPPARELADYPLGLFTGRALPASLARVLGPDGAHAAKRGKAIAAAEVVLQADTLVDVVGYKTETIDAQAGSRVGRSPPTRVALCAGRIPLIVTPRPPPS